MVNLEITGRMGVTTYIGQRWMFKHRLIAKPIPEDGNGSDQILLRHDNEEIGVIATIDELREIVRRWDAGV